MLEQNDTITMKCLPVTQPVGTFYIGAMAASDLVGIAWADVRAIVPSDPEFAEGPDDASEMPTIQPESAEVADDQGLDGGLDTLYDQSFEQFLGIQRELSKTRLKNLRQYVTNMDATFPTSILLAVSSRQALYDEEESTITIVRDPRAAKIIDGQHRIAALRRYSGPPFEVNVSVFVDMDIQDQAMVFATINLSQTKVNKSLAYDLYEFMRTRSPQKSAHDIVRFLNYKPGSPFQSRIKMLGTGSGLGMETITQAAFVDRLLRYISTNAMQDRDLLRRRKRLTRPSANAAKRLIFRNLFIDDRDVHITIILWNYYLAVQAKWPKSWSCVERGNIFNRTTGFGALMRFLKVAYNSFQKPSRVILRDDFATIFERISLKDGSFTPDEYVPGGSGEKKLFDAFVDEASLNEYK